MVFAPNQVNWQQQFVDAWVPVAVGNSFANWQKRRMPLPSSIYENVFVHLAIQGYAKPLRNMAKAYHIPIFNPALPGKWQMAKSLENSRLAKYQPATQRLANSASTIAKINTWGMAYVKPIGGYGGAGVARIQQLGRGQYRLGIDRQVKTGGKIRTVLTERELGQWLAIRQQTPQIVQRGLDLLTVGTRKVDFRVVVQRNRHGDWELIGIIPKLAAKDGVVTNIVAGGEISALPDLIEAAIREGTTIPVHRMTACALHAAKYLSNRIPETGILGFDIGVEQGGKVYLIEMNPKPARSLLSHDMRRVSARLAGGFAIYLAKGSKQN